MSKVTFAANREFIRITLFRDPRTLVWVIPVFVSGFVRKMQTAVCSAGLPTEILPLLALLWCFFFVQKDESAQDIRSIFANTEAAKFRKTKRDKRDHRHRIGSGRQGSGLIRMKSDIPVNRIFWRRG